jgi:hypothetical protein
VSPRAHDPSTVPESNERGTAPDDLIGPLSDLTRALDELGIAAQLVESSGRPLFERATSPAARELIAPARHVESAADRVQRVLTPGGMT